MFNWIYPTTPRYYEGPPMWQYNNVIPGTTIEAERYGDSNNIIVTILTTIGTECAYFVDTKENIIQWAQELIDFASKIPDKEQT